MRASAQVRSPAHNTNLVVGRPDFPYSLEVCISHLVWCARGPAFVRQRPALRTGPGGRYNPSGCPRFRALHRRQRGAARSGCVPVDEVADVQDAVATLVDLVDRGVLVMTDENNPWLA